MSDNSPNANKPGPSPDSRHGEEGKQGGEEVKQGGDERKQGGEEGKQGNRRRLTDELAPAKRGKFSRLRKWPTTLALATAGILAAGVLTAVMNGNSWSGNRGRTAQQRGITTGQAVTSSQPVSKVPSSSVAPTTIASFAAPPHSGPAVWPNLDRLTVSLAGNTNVATAEGGKIPLVVRLMGKAGDTMGPVSVTVANGKTNPQPYHEVYAVTQQGTVLSQNAMDQQVSVTVPEQSGVYQITVTSKLPSPPSTPAGQSNNVNLATPRTEADAKLTIYVDHGGFYRHSNLTQTQHLKVGALAVNVIGVKMTSTYTEIRFTANTSSADMQVFENVAAADGTVHAMAMAEQQTTIMSQRIPQWDVYTSPVQTGAKSLTLKFKTDAGINNQWPASTASVTIPLPQPGAQS